MEAGTGVRKSPIEQGLWFVSSEPGTTLQDHGTQWQVGERYRLIRVLGYGSYSGVCLAVDETTGEKVALKRVADVLQSPEHTKRVLREICILRRLRHPNLIAIRDAFVRPSATGQCRMRGGKLVNLSVDVYIAMELADGGDLFHLRGQMSSDEVKSLMWQLLVTIKYLHSLHVWHRDMKSQNVFLVSEQGDRVIKIGDFGSARSAIPQGYQWAEQSAPNRQDTVELPAQEPRRQGHQRHRGQGPALLHSADSYQAMNEAMKPEDLYVRPDSQQGFKAPLTRVVATPCYRAPEVVMSRGGYTAAIDMWSLGCIFGELLQRIAHLGSAATPNLQVAPLFAIHGLPKTPEDGESFVGGPGSEMTRNELEALFAVIGTPCWADVAAVQEPSWRRYLHHLPGRAPTLYRRFAAAGEAAVDLLSRLLAFDPTRRCSPDEALGHEYFSDMMLAPLPTGLEDFGGQPMAPPGRSTRGAAAFAGGGGQGGEPAAGSGATVAAAAGAADRSAVSFSEPATPVSELQPYHPSVAAAAAAEAAAAQAPCSLAGPFASRLQVSSSSSEPGAASSSAAPAAAAAAGRPGAGQTAGRHYWEESDPSRALSMLEDDLSQITATYCTASPEDEGCQQMRRLLEAECEAIRASLLGGGAAGAGSGPGGAGEPGGGGKKRARVLQPGGGDPGSIASLLKTRTGGLQVDTAASPADADRFGRERLSNVADTWQGRELDPSRILGPQRHGEWFEQKPRGHGAPSAGAWGVSSLPPGMDEGSVDPKLLAIMRAQQGR